MSTLKEVLCLLAIVVAYGIAGRMDHDDAVMLEEAQQAAGPANCHSGQTLTVDGPEARTNDLPFDPQADSVDASAPEGDVPCVSHVF